MDGPDYEKILKLSPEILKASVPSMNDDVKADILEYADGAIRLGGILINVAALIASVVSTAR